MDDGYLIDLLGGTAVVARRIRSKPASVSEWKGRGMPEGRRIELAASIEKRGGPKRWQLRPTDWYLIWPELIGAAGAPPVPNDHPAAEAA